MGHIAMCYSKLLVNCTFSYFGRMSLLKKKKPSRVHFVKDYTAANIDAKHFARNSKL